MKKIFALFCFALIILRMIPIEVQAQNNPTTLSNLIINLREADSGLKTNKIIKKITKLDVSYDSLVAEIKSGRYYSKNKKTGYIEWNYSLDSLNYTCIVIIPSGYSPTKKYPASFILHGGVMSLNPVAVTNTVTPNTYNYDSLDRIIVYPAGWAQSPWWSEKQVHNLKYLVHRLKLEYNVDENNISLSGISDGGTGIIYIANKMITPWANLKPYISNPGGVTKLGGSPVYLKNLGNKPFLFISSEKDELFPPQLIESFLAKMRNAKCDYNFYLAKGYHHDISWLNIYRDTIRDFMKINKRNPYPPELFWQTENTKYGANHWVIIDKLGNKPESDETKYPVLVPKSKKAPKSGAIKVHCTGNQIHVETKNVKRYTLLLSPEHFNFNEKIEVFTNNKLSFSENVRKDPQILLKWYNKGLDRSMLFGCEITIKVN